MTYAMHVASGLTTYDQARDPSTHQPYPVLPEDPGTVHAVLAPLQFADGPVFRDFGPKPHARCGARCAVILPIEFNRDDPDACPECCQRDLDDTWAAWEDH